MARFVQPKDIVIGFEDALNAKDAESLGELFTQDAEFVNIVGQRMHGREGIIQDHAKAFTGPLKELTFDFDAVDEVRVTAEVMVLHVHCLRARLPSARADPTTLDPTMLELVIRCGPDGWRPIAGTNVVQASPSVGG
jgi:uncharacterized protein (TIGR02246 family)